ncbi:hypothetical protein A2625_04535 [candidate division WOR-1 bacterium RIFCSPHIGHO2_01_FULL_53_15]|uniref:Mannosyl-glycoprotein endo-beta-N-acetylglucosamidase-like domain-containing protein n=1 Tax=candidate division WOR-1 bacterium RIFCSPHIGHO2_01_FULL_53_15 TaxID=1802564 RepID=A0A1F4PZF6_UNCSA|nr:MAG: hypothetical protein A2625_04535 [candidate division WOR-1 bacterium RIFCSPHIGHO2_01_FULL_53_15]OGC10604.1 MAG: hypothetical protein A3D23_03755 [candidate division WOR-1 bacterium RIFCSPHIGHO2_02_FULL_53_26]
MLKRAVSIILLLIVFAGMGLSQFQDPRAAKLRKFLDKYPDSPLKSHVNEMVYCADHFGLDYRLYLAIAGAESTFGRCYPKRNHNLTGVANGGKRFRSIYDNIYRTNELIATGKWYRRYRKTRNIKDFVYTYKGKPPYKHYISTIRYVFAEVEKISVNNGQPKLLLTQK